jgi:hypothetical protein
VYIFDHISLSFSQNEKYSDKSCKENQNTLFMFNNFFSENRAVYEIMWKNVVERYGPQMTIQRMPIVCWIPKAKNTRSKYVIHIAFRQQQWLHELAPVLRYTYIACLVSQFFSVYKVLICLATEHLVNL